MEPQYLMIGGRTCAGKTTLIRSLEDHGETLFDRGESVILDTDSIKSRLPGYTADRACLFHTESCQIFEEISRRAISDRLNVVHELTMWNAAGVLRRAREFVEAGYDISAYYLFVPPQLATERALERYATTDRTFSGRFVPPEAILGFQENNEAAFDVLCEFANEWRFYDNQRENVELVASGVTEDNVSFSDTREGFEVHTHKGTTKVSEDCTVVTSEGLVISNPSKDAPYCDSNGEPLRFSDGAPILLRHFLNDPD